jgi:hypothetical protein
LKLLDDSMESKIYQDICPLSFLENQKQKPHILCHFDKKLPKWQNLARKKNIFLSKTRIAIKLELNKENYDLHVNSFLPLITLNNGYYLLYNIMLYNHTHSCHDCFDFTYAYRNKTNITLVWLPYTHMFCSLCNHVHILWNSR